MAAVEKMIQRFSLAQRFEHIILVLSFTILGFTGLPQKYALSPISQAFISFLGGIENIRIIHRVAATVFLLEAVYHVVVVGWKLYVERRSPTMVPTLKDGTDMLQSFLYNIGLRKTPPEMPRYNYGEKMEYWAMLWGFFVMAATGFMLWNPIITTNYLPGAFIPAAKIAHGGEAVLAVLAIIIWHFYNVHIRHLNTSMFTGKMDRGAMEEEHGAELKEIDAGKAGFIAPEAVRKQRAVAFWPVAIVLSVVMLAFVYWFVTFEKTAIATLPPEQQGQVFVPVTPTPAPTATQTPTPAPTQEGGAEPSALTWETGIQDLFAAKCGSCHGTMGGYSVETYADVMTQVTAGDPDNSKIVEVQIGAHPGKFSDDELQQVIDWITAGAAEK